MVVHRAAEERKHRRAGHKCAAEVAVAQAECCEEGQLWCEGLVRGRLPQRNKQGGSHALEAAEAGEEIELVARRHIEQIPANQARPIRKQRDVYSLNRRAHMRNQAVTPTDRFTTAAK